MASKDLTSNFRLHLQGIARSKCSDDLVLDTKPPTTSITQSRPEIHYLVTSIFLDSLRGERGRGREGGKEGGKERAIVRICSLWVDWGETKPVSVAVITEELLGDVGWQARKPKMQEARRAERQRDVINFVRTAERCFKFVRDKFFWGLMDLSKNASIVIVYKDSQEMLIESQLGYPWCWLGKQIIGLTKKGCGVQDRLWRRRVDIVWEGGLLKSTGEGSFKMWQKPLCNSLRQTFAHQLLPALLSIQQELGS